MKRCLLWLFFILLASGAGIAAYEPIMSGIRDKPVEKTILFSLYRGSNYSSKVYRGSSAEIYIAVEKVRSTTRTVVWDTTVDAMLLSKYPSAKKAMSKKITIPNVIENKEHLEMNYVLTYNSNGSILKMQSSNFIFNGTDTLAIML
jgi:hypothetical protein